MAEWLLGTHDCSRTARLLDRQVGRIFPLENAAAIVADKAERIPETGSVTHQAAGRGEFALIVDGRNGILRRERHDLIAPAG